MQALSELSHHTSNLHLRIFEIFSHLDQFRLSPTTGGQFEQGQCFQSVLWLFRHFGHYCHCHFSSITYRRSRICLEIGCSFWRCRLKGKTDSARWVLTFCGGVNFLCADRKFACDGDILRKGDVGIGDDARNSHDVGGIPSLHCINVYCLMTNCRWYDIVVRSGNGRIQMILWDYFYELKVYYPRRCYSRVHDDGSIIKNRISFTACDKLMQENENVEWWNDDGHDGNVW